MVTTAICVLVILLLCVASGVTQSDYIYTHPQSVVAVVNSTVTFTCSGDSESSPENSHVSIKNDVITGDDVNYEDMPQSKPHGIVVSGTCTDSGDNCTFTIEVPATIVNNNTEVSCTFHPGTGPSEETEEAYLYIASEELGSNNGFSNFLITSRNLSSLSITWSKPWSHLVNSYTVTINNKSNNSWTDYDTTDRVWTLVNGISDGCTQYYVYVTAYTDIGSVRSSVNVLVFPMLIQPLSSETLQTEVFATVSHDLKLRVYLTEKPVYCPSAQTVYYNITITDTATHDVTATKGPLIDPDTFMDIQDNRTYMVDLLYYDDSTGFQHSINTTISVEFWDPPNTITASSIFGSISLSTTISSLITANPMSIIITSTPTTVPSVSYGTTSTRVVSVTSTSCIMEPSAQLVRGAVNNSTSLISVSVVLGVCIAVLLVILSVLMLCVVQMRSALLRKKRIQGTLANNAESPLAGLPPPIPHRNRSHLIFSRPTPRGGNPIAEVSTDSFPREMTPNPIYQSSEALYADIKDDIPQHKPLTKARPHPLQQTMTLPLTLDKLAIAQEEQADSNEQYMHMTSPEAKPLQPRYTQPPLTLSSSNITTDLDDESSSKTTSSMPPPPLRLCKEDSAYESISDSNTIVLAEDSNN